MEVTHTFQQGDRVIDTIDGAKGTVNNRNEYGHWLVLRDDRLAYGWYPYFSCREDSLRHDTNFQVGDWVRYEAIDQWGTQYDGAIGEITQVSHTTSFVMWQGENKPRHHVNEYLVKIQPPQEGSMPPYHIGIENAEDDAIERGIKEKIQLLERQVEKAKCCLETYRDLKRFINQEDHHGTR